ncbi:hypothetical protein KCU65_g2679, partial [Aureobasidium melanogenum]
MSQNLPPWPVGYPAVALGSYDAANATGIRITRGDQVKVIGTMNAPGTQIQLVRIEYSNPVRRGWVRRTVVRIGTRARLGEPVAVVLEIAPTTNLIGATISPHNPAGRLWRTVTSLIDAFYANRESLPMYNKTLDDVKKRPDEAANQVFEGFRKIRRRQGGTQLDTLSDPGFTVHDLANVEEIHRGDDTEWWIVYLIVYYFANNRKPEIYDGKSIRPSKRKQKHIDTTRSTTLYKNSIHYKAAREATSFQMVPICALPTNTKWLFLAEQLVQSMLQTTARLYTSKAPFTMPTAGVHDLQSSAGTFALDQMAGSTLKHISDQVFDSEHWPGAIERTSFGSTVGLNAKSALTEANRWDKTGWTVSYAKGMGFNIRRAGKRIMSEGRVFESGSVCINLTQPQLDFIGINTEVHLVFELKDNDAEHEYCYARLPDLFGTNDVAKANSWGLRVEWSQGGVWKAIYVQHERMDALYRAYRDVPAALTSYRTGILIYHFLKNQTINPGPDLPFLQDAARPTMKGVVAMFDHAEQVVRVRDVRDPTNVSHQDGPRLLTDAEVEANIRAKIDPTRHTDLRVPTGYRKGSSCDGCKIAKHPGCDTKNGHCTRCTTFNTICTFSDFSGNSMYPLAVALRQKPLQPYNVFDIPDPAVQIVSMDEEGDIGDEGVDEDED